jgi:YidC/Oxa1 family membrane protein insertase
MNKNSIIGGALIFLIIVGYSMWMAPTDEQIAEQRHADSIAQVEHANKVRQQIQDSIAFAKRQTEQTAIAEAPSNQQDDLQNDSLSNDLNLSKYGSFAAAAKGEDQDIIIENEVLKLKVSRKGGVITYAEVKNFRTYDTLPLVLFDKSTAEFSLLLNDKHVETKDLYFVPLLNGMESDQDSFYVADGQNLTFSMRVYPNDNNGNIDRDRYLEFEYLISGDNYMLGFNLNMKGMYDYVMPGYSYMTMNWDLAMTGKEKDPEQERKQTTIYYKYKDADVDYLSEMDKEDSEELKTKVNWISYKQQFFAATIIAENSFKTADISFNTDENSHLHKYLQTMHTEFTIPLSGSDVEKFPMKIYYGPNKYKILSSYNMDLDQQIPLGWGFFLLQWINRYVTIPVFDFLSGFGWNYGIIILVLTVLLKIFLFPIAYKTYLSSAKMRVLKPEIDEIGEKFPKKEDSMKKQQATMALYKKAGVNPMAGCLPMLLQMPILFALFRFFPASIELRQQSFLWADDLSSYDVIFSWTQHIPLLSDFYGNHVSLFTILMTISTILYTKMNNQMMSSSQQMPGMKTMMYLMPLMFLGFFNNYASGLSYYYFLANIITFSQMYLMRKFVDEDAIHAKLQANKKKPAKKSKFQQKLEDMAKQKEAMAKQKGKR